MKRQVIPDGYKKCTLCKAILKESSDYFYHAPCGKNGLNSRCKECSNKLRRERWFNKTSHNVSCRCYKCGTFFYQARATLNRMKRRQKIDNPKTYCPDCPRPSGRSGMSWEGKRRGENNPNAIMTEREVRLIKKALKNGLTNKEICDLYHEKPSTISQIKLGKRWSHVMI